MLSWIEVSFEWDCRVMVMGFVLVRFFKCLPSSWERRRLACWNSTGSFGPLGNRIGPVGPIPSSRNWELILLVRFLVHRWDRIGADRNQSPQPTFTVHILLDKFWGTTFTVHLFLRLIYRFKAQNFTVHYLLCMVSLGHGFIGAHPSPLRSPTPCNWPPATLPWPQLIITASVSWGSSHHRSGVTRSSQDLSLPSRIAEFNVCENDTIPSKNLLWNIKQRHAFHTLHTLTNNVHLEHDTTVIHKLLKHNWATNHSR